MYVNVRHQGKPFDPEKGQVLAIRHCYRLRLVWEDERHLRIDHMSSGSVDRQQARIGEVSVRFRPVPQDQLPEPYEALPADVTPASSPVP